MGDCKASIDGWCETHSTGDGPSWCVDSLRDALRRARFHERENYQRIQDQRARAERYRLAWTSARQRATEREDLIEQLADEQARRCVYGTREGDGRTCDCKFWGLRRTSEVTGCPELRQAIWVIRAATDEGAT